MEGKVSMKPTRELEKQMRVIAEHNVQVLTKYYELHGHELTEDERAKLLWEIEQEKEKCL